MEKKTFSEIQEEYDFEIDKIVKTIKKEKAKRVLLQFPDGLKPYATIITDELKRRVKKAEFIVWLGSCYGACDVPNLPGNMKIDLIVQFGHSKFDFS